MREVKKKEWQKRTKNEEEREKKEEKRKERNNRMKRGLLVERRCDGFVSVEACEIVSQEGDLRA